MNDLVSVITRTKDRHAFLADAVGSVANSTWRPVEHIIVNDGGADVSAVVAPYRDRLDIKVIDTPGVGRCKAGNLGLAAARGTYVQWLDDDDLLYPDHIRSLVLEARRTGHKIVYSDADVIHQTRLPSGAYREVSRTPAPVFEGTKIALWRRGDLHLVMVLHHRECTDRLGGFDESLPVLEDMEMFGRFAQDYQFHRLPGITAGFRVRDDATNAVTAMRTEFAETRAVLYRRYAHIVMPELLTMVEFGAVELAALKARVEALEAVVREYQDKHR